MQANTGSGLGGAMSLGPNTTRSPALTDTITALTEIEQEQPSAVPLPPGVQPASVFFLASGAADGSIVMWPLQPESPDAPLQGNVFVPPGANPAAGGGHGGHGGGQQQVQVSQTGTYASKITSLAAEAAGSALLLLVGHENGALLVRPTMSNDMPLVIANSDYAHKGPLRAIHPEGLQLFFTGSDDGVFSVWQLQLVGEAVQ
jgi:WD40 repeat protein